MEAPIAMLEPSVSWLNNLRILWFRRGLITWCFIKYKRYNLKKTILFDILIPAALLIFILLPTTVMGIWQSFNIPYLSLIIYYLPFVTSGFWLSKDKLSRFCLLMRLMGLKSHSYYVGAYSSIMLVMGPWSLISAFIISIRDGRFLFYTFFYLVFSTNLIAILFWLTSSIRSKLLPYILAAFIPCESAIHFLLFNRIILVYTKDQLSRRLFIYLSTINPFQSIRLMVCSTSERSLVYYGYKSDDIILVTNVFISMITWSILANFLALYYDSGENRRLFKLPLYIGRYLSDICSKKPKADQFNCCSDTVGIHLDSVTKAYDGHNVVDNVTMDILRGEITFVLGSSEAGKTTLVNMILNYLRPTSGTIYINGCHVRGNRLNIGVCMQDNILCDYLTVEQHLMLFYQIKLKQDSVVFMTQTQMQLHVDSILHETDLLMVRNTHPNNSKSFTFESKRKLCLAMALVGDNDLLIVDELFSPSDQTQYNNRHLWEAVEHQSTRNRSILITSQSMDEADYLSDRIAIMVEGKVVCCDRSYIENVMSSQYNVKVYYKMIEQRQQIINLVQRYFSEALIIQELQLTSNQQGNDATTINQSIASITMRFTVSISGHDDDNMLNLLEELEIGESNNTGVTFELQHWHLADILSDASKFSTLNSGVLSVERGQPSTERADVVVNLADDELSWSNDQRALLAKINALDPGGGSHYCTGSTQEKLGLMRAFVTKNILYMRHSLYTHIIWRLMIPLVVIVLSSVNVRYELTQYEQKLQMDSTADCRLKLILVTISDLADDFKMAPLFLVLNFIYLPSNERTSNFKSQQLCSKATCFIYWLSQYLVDMLNIILFALMFYISLIVIVPERFITVSIESIAGPQLALALLLVFITFGSSILLLAYCISCLTETNMQAYIIFSMILLRPPVHDKAPVTKMLIRLVKLLADNPISWLTKIMSLLLRYILPTEAFGSVMASIFEVALVNNGEQAQLFSIKGHFVAGLQRMLFQATLFLFVLYYLETRQLTLNNLRLFSGILRHCRTLSWRIKTLTKTLFKSNTVSGENDNSNEEIITEINRVDCCLAEMKQTPAKSSNDAQPIDPVIIDSPVLLVKNLTKIYEYPTRAVNELTLALDKKECLALWGLSDSGKTSTVKMLIGEDLNRHSGEIWCNNQSIKQHPLKYKRQVSYVGECNTAIGLNLTVRQALNLMVDLRLNHNHNRETIEMVDCYMEAAKIGQYADVTINKLYGAAKRKVSLIIALIGAPPLVVLDEPTIDVESRQEKQAIWRLIRSRVAQCQSIVVTSKSFEECEAICNRVAVMVRGKLDNLASVEQLRRKNRNMPDRGYLVRLKFTKNSSTSRPAKQLRPIVDNVVQDDDISSSSSGLYLNAEEKAEIEQKLKLLKRNLATIGKLSLVEADDDRFDRSNYNCIIRISKQQESAQMSVDLKSTSSLTTLTRSRLFHEMIKLRRHWQHQADSIRFSFSVCDQTLDIMYASRSLKSS